MLDVASFVLDVASFDAGYFRLSPVEAIELDTHVRQALETSLEAMLHGAQQEGSTTGVYAAACASDFATDTAMFNLPRQIASALSLGGPTGFYDKACTSSHLALHSAWERIQGKGPCSAALVVGVTLMLQPSVSASLLLNGILSPTGHCLPLDQQCNALPTRNHLRNHLRNLPFFDFSRKVYR